MENTKSSSLLGSYGTDQPYQTSADSLIILLQMDKKFLPILLVGNGLRSDACLSVSQITDRKYGFIFTKFA